MHEGELPSTDPTLILGWISHGECEEALFEAMDATAHIYLPRLGAASEGASAAWRARLGWRCLPLS